MGGMATRSLAMLFKISYDGCHAHAISITGIARVGMFIGLGGTAKRTE